MIMMAHLSYHQLNSYFEFSGLSPSTEPVEMRISADNLVVENVDDLDCQQWLGQLRDCICQVWMQTLWARRDLQFGDLNGRTHSGKLSRPIYITCSSGSRQWKTVKSDFLVHCQGSR